MHIVSYLEVKNFRSIYNHKFNLSSYTPLIGYNNAGKSNIIQALKWFIRPLSLNSSDFFDSGCNVEVIGSIEGITSNILNQLTSTNATKIKKYLHFNRLVFKRIQQTPNCSVKDIKLEVLDYGYGYVPDVWKPNPTGLSNAIKELFPDIIEIGAMEDADGDTGKYKKGNTIGKLISEIMKPIEQNYTEEINNKLLKGISQKFNIDGNKRLKELKKFDTEATKSLNDFFPGLSIKVDIPTPSVKTLLESGQLKVIENSDARNLNEYGHGTQRSVQMALIKYLSDIQKNNKFTTTLLLIDEPELYLHPQAIEQIRISLKKLSKYGYQVIFSTHSPHMIVSKDILNTLIVQKQDKKTYLRKRMIDAIKLIDIRDKHKTQFELLMTLTNSSQILFSEKVIIVEGTTEIRLLPTLFYKKIKKTLHEQKIALVEQGGVASTKKMKEVLSSMDIKTKVIVDLDFAFRNAIKMGFLTDSDIQPCKNYFASNPHTKIQLAGDGFPQKVKGSSIHWEPSKCFEWLATQSTMKPIIDFLHQKLKNQNIWLWTRGAIEKHLNLNSKDENAWMMYLQNFENKSFGRYVRDKKVKEMIEWINE
jgi:putative ATP-dependent endonuclease of the OLD family